MTAAAAHATTPASAPDPSPAARSGDRRSLAFASLDDLRADVDRLLERGGGELATIGEITPAQNLWHVAYFIDHAVTGFPFTMPIPMRVFGRLIRNRFLNNPIKPGIKPPPGAPDLSQIVFPPADTPLDDAVRYLRDSIAAATPPGAMRCPSPLFGRLTHGQWVQLHCRHAELHFSFLHPRA